MKNIKKIISIVVLTLFVKSLSAQVGQARILECQRWSYGQVHCLVVAKKDTDV